MNSPKIVLLAGKGISTNILYNALIKDFTVTAIILEEPVSKKQFLKKRIKKQGIIKVVGQILFQLLIVKFLDLFSKGRKKEILLQYAMHDNALPYEKIIQVRSVNDETCIQILQSLQPNLVIVNGTRIISSQVLNCVSSNFINIHAGITPKYRGVHGAYWALVNNEPENCGVTVHLVDPGIDTGAVIAQKTITITQNDNFVTYPLLQLAEGLPLIKSAISAILDDNLSPKDTSGESRLWYHPTISQYFYNRIIKGKK